MSKTSIKKIAKAVPKFPFETYAHIVSPLPTEEGGGYLITFPDLPGCMSDGETEADAVSNGRDAFESWVSARIDAGKAIPEPAYRPDRSLCCSIAQNNPFQTCGTCKSGGR